MLCHSLPLTTMSTSVLHDIQNKVGVQGEEACLGRRAPSNPYQCRCWWCRHSDLGTCPTTARKLSFLTGVPVDPWCSSLGLRSRICVLSILGWCDEAVWVSVRPFVFLQANYMTMFPLPGNLVFLFRNLTLNTGRLSGTNDVWVRWGRRLPLCWPLFAGVHSAEEVCSLTSNTITTFTTKTDLHRYTHMLCRLDLAGWKLVAADANWSLAAFF